MRPLLHPALVNGRFGDPALYVEWLFERHALLIDLGDIAPLSPRKINRIDRVFVSHTHVDHFIGFDQLLRVLVGREKTVELFGPAGFVDQVGHKLHAYQWNLAERYANEVVFIVTEIEATHATRTVRFRLGTRFAAEELSSGRLSDGVVLAEPAYRVSTAVLDHRTPCLGFAVEETAHLNVWKNRLAERNLPVGSWLKALKRAVIEERPDDYPILVRPEHGTASPRQLSLGALRSVLTVTPGQKVGYVTDVADTAANREAIVGLVKNADVLFIEAAFSADDSDLAAERAHLTTTAAGEIARAASVARVEPFHFSARYEGQEERMLAEVGEVFAARSGGEGARRAG